MSPKVSIVNLWKRNSVVIKMFLILIFLKYCGMASILMDFVKPAHVLPVRISRSSLDLFVTSDNFTLLFFRWSETVFYHIITATWNFFTQGDKIGNNFNEFNIFTSSYILILRLHKVCPFMRTDHFLFPVKYQYLTLSLW